MTQQQQEELNRFFVHVFNQIMALEEAALRDVGAKDLSVKELHVLEAVGDLTDEGRNTMTQIADALSIRVSTLTTAVNTLVRKGYLKRGGEPGDRRIIRVTLTPRGQEADRVHEAFHAKMVQDASAGLTEDGLEVLLQSLHQLDHFFTEMGRQGRDSARLEGHNTEESHQGQAQQDA